MSRDVPLSRSQNRSVLSALAVSAKLPSGRSDREVDCTGPWPVNFRGFLGSARSPIQRAGSVPGTGRSPSRSPPVTSTTPRPSEKQRRRLDQVVWANGPRIQWRLPAGSGLTPIWGRALAEVGIETGPGGSDAIASRRTVSTVLYR